MKSNETLQHTISCQKGMLKKQGKQIKRYQQQNPSQWIVVKRSDTKAFGGVERYTTIIDLDQFFRFDVRHNEKTNTYIVQGYLRFYNGLSNVQTIYDNIETEEKAHQLLYKILSIVEKKKPQSRLMQYVQNQ